MTSKDVIKRLEAAGWVLVRISGDHHTFKHPANPLVATVQHPCREFPKGTLRQIERKTGVPMR